MFPSIVHFRFGWAKPNNINWMPEITTTTMTGNDVDVDADDVDELTGKENERKPEEKSSSTNPNGKAIMSAIPNMDSCVYRSGWKRIVNGHLFDAPMVTQLIFNYCFCWGFKPYMWLNQNRADQARPIMPMRCTTTGESCDRPTKHVWKITVKRSRNTEITQVIK